ncbi:anaerobic ribonucleoside-triphosphate reductase [Grosmannia clavigera kw1407]|uniref:Anaerobic ribonucleoside-triphosphate reductase n=1 Tax=Grosmannia clavigera (strain kw1407 / UAMH 11150) TaxID=655863 RepID=F0X9K2_GROCL|nr:anaerobic ribonucleoside-triphosphate reductase [Grosmannia clavigera kw1407]EFX06089.1 anaerobic ribonucleoside-triphosphate reductase [Grosmannia clavigera kw1407]
MPESQISNVHLVDAYLERTTWKGNENANSTYSHQGLMQYVSQHVISGYWLDKIYTEEIREYNNQNRFHIHDLGFLSAYCSGWSLEDILLQGFGGVENKIQCRPPKHLNTALNQTVNFLFTLQGELAGAQALSSFDTYLAPFIRHDNLPYSDVFKYVQSFVYSLNVPTRSGFQAPFTNISLDLICPKTLEQQAIIIGGKPHPTLLYSDFQDEMDMINKAFAEVMIQGDGNGNIFTFPIPTYNLYKGLDWESPRWESIWEMTAKYGVPYFANFINSDLNPEDFRSMCCRLRLDLTKLHCRVGGQYGASPLTGSIGVVTLNLPNLAYRSNGSKDVFFAELAATLRVAKESLEIKRRIVNENSELYPYAAHYLAATKERTGSYWTNHFSTIGINGMNEALIALFGDGIAVHRDFALETMEFIKDKLQEFQTETGNLYNLEASPAESACYKLARRDKELFPDRTIPVYYTNSTMLPVNATSDLFECLDHQEDLHCSYTGGTIFHAFLGERLSGWTMARDLVKMLTTRYRVPYITLSPTFSVCKTHGYIAGEHSRCNRCDEVCLVYSRIVGYYRPTRDWNKGKAEEFKQRKTYLNPLEMSKESSQLELERQVAEIADADLPVAGYTKLTLSDWPGKMEASIMFTSRCNLACPWCHNGPLVNGERDKFTPLDIFRHITETPHKSLVISGGEPTIHKGLLPFMRLLKKAGVSIKLDHNGTSPATLLRVFDEKLVDFVAMDIKCALGNYKKATGKKVSPKMLESSIEMIKASGVAHEFRTTVVPSLVEIEDLFEAKRLAGGKLKLQRFRKGENNLGEDFRDCQEHTDNEFKAIVLQVAEA